MKRSSWSVLMLLAAVACGGGSDPEEGTNPFGPGGGAGGSTAGGSTAGGSPGGGSPGGTGICQSKTVASGQLPPDILVVLDRSGSMAQARPERWTPSVRGLNSIVGQLHQRVRFGLVTFPGQGGGGGGGENCAPGTLRVPIGANNAAPISDALSQTRPGGYTPTSMTLAAVKELLPTGANPDSLVAPKYVLLVTDGAPNCINGQIGSLGGQNVGGQPEAVDASVAEIKALRESGVKVYVLGYDTQNTPALKMALDRMAAEGGTGATEHTAIGNEQGLVDAFRAISENAIGCDFVLEKPVSNPEKVKVLLDGKQLRLNQPNGFSIGADKRTVSLQGSSCELVKEEGHVVSVSEECESQIIVLE